MKNKQVDGSFVQIASSNNNKIINEPKKDDIFSLKYRFIAYVTFDLLLLMLIYLNK